MNFKPIDEMSLRQLFSTDFSKELLRLSYIGPVLNKNTGKIDDSPDALILDMRKSPHQIKRCEFKYAPKSKGDFSHNGNFDIAVMWSIQPPLTRQQLEKELFEQNGLKGQPIVINYPHSWESILPNTKNDMYWKVACSK